MAKRQSLKKFLKIYFEFETPESIEKIRKKFRPDFPDSPVVNVKKPENSKHTPDDRQ